MNSRMNFGGGFSIPQEHEFQIRGSWIPATPDKPILTRSLPIPVERQGNQLGRDWQELVGFPNGYLQETTNYNGAVQNLDPNRLMDLNGDFCDWDAAFTDKNQPLNHIASSYAQAFGSDSARWNNNPLAELLGIKNAASLAPDNSTMNRSNYVANRPLIPNSHSQVNSNWRESNTASSFLTNNNCSGSGLWNNSLPQIPQCE